MTDSDVAAFLAAHTRLGRTGLVPEIALHLACEAYAIFQAADEIGAARPFWAFAWPGGQALARWLIDNPGEVAGRRVLDLGTGSGITAIAALMAGARTVEASDTDPLACAVARQNAEANGFGLVPTSEDLLGSAPDVDLVIVGEVFYEPEMALRVTGFLEAARRRGLAVLYADRPGMRRPPVALELVAEMVAPLTPGLEMGDTERARIWRLSPARGGGGSGGAAAADGQRA